MGKKRIVVTGGASWCLVVVIVIVVLAPGASDEGFAVQAAAAAGKEQETETLFEKPSMALTASVYVAELPERTVNTPGCGDSEKSGPTTVRGKTELVNPS